MDNITHALAGVLTAEVAVQLRRRLGHPVSPRWERAAWVASALAHNAPDLDAVYTRLTVAPLGYLLHHRGHTHTLLAAPVLGLVAYGLGSLFGRGQGWSRADRLWLLALSLLGPVGHLALDLSNSYGVHPLWPLHDGWFYGDSIFIVEPLFWACTLPLVITASESWVSRVVAGVILAAGLGLAAFGGFVPWPFPVVVVALALLTLAVGVKVRPGRRAAFSLGASLTVLLSFVVNSHAAARITREQLAVAYPEFQTIDVARTPLPATPICWQTIAVQRDARDRYALRTVRVSTWPGLLSPGACHGRRGEGELTAPVTRVDREAGVSARIELSLEAPRAQLREVAARCDGAALMRFLRMPFVAPRAGGEAIAGDLRYDREPGPGFSEMRLPATVSTCPSWVSPWTPPRTDLLTAP